MRLNLKFCFAIACMGLALLVLPCVHAQQSAPAVSPSTQTSGDGLSRPNKMDAPETNGELDEFRHSAAVASLARYAHLKTEVAAKIFEDINSAILILLILWFGFKLVPKMLRNRSDALQKQLFEARAATAQANERLAVVEERLSKLGIEIEAIREQTERESLEDEKRIGAAMEAERQRIVASAEQEIELAGAAAQRELKKFAADLAVDRALERIRLTAEDDRVLIRNFGEELKAERN